MIIDTHTHICPDKIAPIVANNTVERLGIKIYGDFTVRGQLSAMDRWGINASQVFCVAEKPSVVQAANDFVASVCDGQRLFGLGTLHPDYENFEEEIDRLKAMKLKGVKFSSTFQDFFVDEERMLRIYQKLSDNDMIVYFHVGKESALSTEEVKTSPQGLARVLEIFPRLKVVAAHFGGLGMLEEVEEYLIGKDIYLDTAWAPSVDMLNPEVIVPIIKKHGPEKIFFGSDYPFNDTQREVNWISKLPIGTEEKERILWKNANEFFGFNLPH